MKTKPIPHRAARRQKRISEARGEALIVLGVPVERLQSSDRIDRYYAETSQGRVFRVVHFYRPYFG